MAAVLTGSAVPPRRRHYTALALLATCVLTYLFFFASPGYPLSQVPATQTSDGRSFLESEVLRADGTKKFDRRMNKRREDNSTDVLFLVLTKDLNSWNEPKGTPHTVEDMLVLLQSTKLDLATVSLAIMTTTDEAYTTIIRATQPYSYGRVTVMLSEPDKVLASLSGKDRHDDAIQYVRRGALARLRNYLMVTALEAESHILWLDADVIRFSEGIVQTMIAHSEKNTTAGIITARCGLEPQGMDRFPYDKNAFRANHAEWLQHAVPEEKFAAASEEDFKARQFTDVVTDHTTDDQLASLSSVGGTLLYIRASLVRYGLMFPWFNIIGTTWARDGWVGLETEGLCWAAKYLEGGGCYVLGGSHHVIHGW